MKLSLILQAVDRWSKPVGSATKANAGLDKSIGGLERNVGRARSALGKFWKDADRGEKIGFKLGSTIRRVAQRDFEALSGAVSRARTHLAAWGRESLKWGARKAGSAIGYGIAGLAVGGIAAGGLFARGVISTGAKFEAFRAMLEGTEGSAGKASKAMSWVSDFAAKTPYEIDEVTDAFVRARGIGIDPLTGSFRILGDAAAGTRKTLMDSIEMMADAQTGEFERLKEFNITSSSKGGLVTFSYIDKAGKNAKVSVKKSMAGIREAILKVLDMKYGGGMERLSKTFTGITSNLSDAYTRFLLRVSDAGIFDKVKASMQRLLDWVSSDKNQATISGWAKRLSDWMSQAWVSAEHFVRDTDWEGVARGIGTIVTALTTVVGMIGRASSNWHRWQLDVERRGAEATANSWAPWTSNDARQRARRRMGEIDNELGHGYRNGGGFVWPDGSFRRAPMAAPWARKGGTPGAAPSAQPKAHVGVHISLDRGLTATPTRLEASGMDMSLRTGRAMGGTA